MSCHQVHVHALILIVHHGDGVKFLWQTWAELHHQLHSSLTQKCPWDQVKQLYNRVLQYGKAAHLSDYQCNRPYWLDGYKRNVYTLNNVTSFSNSWQSMVGNDICKLSTACKCEQGMHAYHCTRLSGMGMGWFEVEKKLIECQTVTIWRKQICIFTVIVVR